MQRRFIPFTLVGSLLVFLIYLYYDYCNSFELLDAKLVKIVDDEETADRKILLFSTLSNYPPNAFIPNRVRTFFYLQPMLCFVTAVGTELKDDGVVTPCFGEVDFSKKWEKLHVMEKSDYAISIDLTADRFDQTQLHYKTMMKQHGIWIKLKLMGYIVPPPVNSKPIFVSFDGYCKTQAEQCNRIFGW